MITAELNYEEAINHTAQDLAGARLDAYFGGSMDTRSRDVSGAARAISNIFAVDYLDAVTKLDDECDRLFDEAIARETKGAA